MERFACPFYCWSDSAVALSWISDEPSRFQVFAANRIPSIQELTAGMEWHYVPTKLNPADILSKGASPSELIESSLWVHGPEFLIDCRSKWPMPCNTIKALPELRKKVLLLLIAYDSCIASLSPFIDDCGLLRVGGRLKNSVLNLDTQHPLILPRRHPITYAIIMHFHRRNLYAGPRALLANIRLHYWPIGGRKTVTSVVSKCTICFQAKPKLAEHIMANLPYDRVNTSYAFMVTGVDFCGPFFYKNEVRNRQPVKCYICIFICFATKAVHMVMDLSTKAFLNAVKRFICTRCRPKRNTLVCHITAIINSRPLLPLSEHPDDLDVLTPAHFIGTAPLSLFEEPDVTKLNINRLDYWQRLSYYQQIFSGRWRQEYLTLLQQRSKWRLQKPGLLVNDIVLVKDENLPPLKWSLARVIKLISGSDGVARVAELKTVTGVIRRAIRKLCPLPKQDEVESYTLPTGGECLVTPPLSTERQMEAAQSTASA